MTHRDVVSATINYESTFRWMMDNFHIVNTRSCEDVIEGE